MKLSTKYYHFIVISTITLVRIERFTFIPHFLVAFFNITKGKPLFLPYPRTAVVANVSTWAVVATVSTWAKPHVPQHV